VIFIAISVRDRASNFDRAQVLSVSAEVLSVSKEWHSGVCLAIFRC
jgi:hypothetical protein